MDPEPHAPTGPQKPLDEAIAEYLMACEAESKSPRTGDSRTVRNSGE